VENSYLTDPEKILSWMGAETTTEALSSIPQFRAYPGRLTPKRR
jgi:hypothetical protein